MLRFAPLLAAGLLLAAGPVRAITLGQVDDFENGTAMGWTEGTFSPNPPTNVATGGPQGAGDHWLRNVSTGEDFVSGGKMVQFNQAQWTGDYGAAGVESIQMMAANFGATTLFLRLAVEGAATQWGSMNAIVLPPDGVWYPATFFLDEMSLIGGAATLPQTLAAVTTFRVMSRQSGPGWQGDVVAGTLGIDVVSAGTRAAAGDAPRPGIALAAAPNPFRGAVEIRFTLPEEGPVRVSIFDVAGRAVRVLDAGRRAAGPQSLTWDGTTDGGASVPPGAYFARLTAGAIVETRRIVRAGHGRP